MWNDIFNTSREREITSHQGTVAYFHQKRPTQTYGLSFSYTISKGKKFENKRIEQLIQMKRIGQIKAIRRAINEDRINWKTIIYGIAKCDTIIKF